MKKMNNSNNNTRKGKKTPQQITNQQSNNVVSAKTEKNRRRRAKQRNNQRAMVMASSMPGVAPSVDTKIRQELRKSMSSISPAGMAFLKCAFAPPDFSGGSVSGYPDSYSGLSLVKKHRFVETTTMLAGFDRYILLSPIPGIAYCYLDITAGSAVAAVDSWNAVPYPDYNSLFPGSSLTADVVSDFRFISNHIEIIPTVNQMTWTGGIQVIKCQVSISIRPSSSGSGNSDNLYTITGLQAANGFGNANQFSGPFINGLYSGAYASDSSRDFSRILEGVTTMPVAAVTGDFTRINTVAFPGLDNTFESVMIRISGIGNNNNNSYLLKTWACVEYKVVVGAALYEYQNLSPCDPVALELYRRIVALLPIAVTYMDNEGFWTRVLSIIKRVSGAMSLMPGPYGLVAGGVNAISSGLEQLAM